MNLTCLSLGHVLIVILNDFLLEFTQTLAHRIHHFSIALHFCNVNLAIYLGQYLLTSESIDYESSLFYLSFTYKWIIWFIYKAPVWSDPLVLFGSH